MGRRRRKIGEVPSIRGAFRATPWIPRQIPAPSEFSLVRIAGPVGDRIG